MLYATYTDGSLLRDPCTPSESGFQQEAPPGFVLEKPENGGRLRYYVLTLVNEPLPTQFPRLPEHKNADFVLEMPENEGFRG